jgi:hypothetical protein
MIVLSQTWLVCTGGYQRPLDTRILSWRLNPNNSVRRHHVG